MSEYAGGGESGYGTGSLAMSSSNPPSCGSTIGIWVPPITGLWYCGMDTVSGVTLDGSGSDCLEPEVAARPWFSNLWLVLFWLRTSSIAYRLSREASLCDSFLNMLKNRFHYWIILDQIRLYLTWNKQPGWGGRPGLAWQSCWRLAKDPIGFQEPLASYWHRNQLPYYALDSIFQWLHHCELLCHAPSKMEINIQYQWYWAKFSVWNYVIKMGKPKYIFTKRPFHIVLGKHYGILDPDQITSL